MRLLVYTHTMSSKGLMQNFPSFLQNFNSYKFIASYFINISTGFLWFYTAFQINCISPTHACKKKKKIPFFINFFIILKLLQLLIKSEEFQYFNRTEWKPYCMISSTRIWFCKQSSYNKFIQKRNYYPKLSETCWHWDFILIPDYY